MARSRAETTAEILRSAKQIIAESDRLSRTFAKELQRVQVDLERSLRRMVRDVERGSTSAIARATEGLKLRAELRDALTKAGYDDLADASTLKGLNRIAQAIGQRRLKASLKSFTQADLNRIKALQQIARQDLLAQGDEVSIAVWRSVVQGQFSQRPVDDILDDLADALDKDLVEVRTLYDTMTAIFRRQVEGLSREAGAVYVYYGPLDHSTRAFCRRHVGKVYEWDAFAKLDNGGHGDPTVVGGGYNCRHALVEISPASASASLVGTGQRIPEYAKMFKQGR